MKTPSTILLDQEVKEKAMPVIQNKMKTSLSRLVNEMLIKLLEKQNANNTIKKNN